MPTKRPRIGEPRLYPGSEVAVLYPGEQMSAQISQEAVIRALATGQHEVVVENWIVEPMPGLRAWFLRWRYRLLGQWRQRRLGAVKVS